MALSGSFVAKTGPLQSIATLPVDIGAAGPHGETSGEALVVAIGGTVPLPSGAATEVTLAAQSAKLPASLGAKAPGASLSVAQAGLGYKLAAASGTTTLGTGAIGDYLSHVVIQPTSLTLAAFSILDLAVVVHLNTATTLSDLRPIIIPINAFSVSGAWKITMGAGGTATGFGVFTP